MDIVSITYQRSIFIEVSGYFIYFILLFLFLLSADCLFFLQNHHFRIKIGNTIRVSDSLDPDQARRFVGPDLGPNCLQR